MTEHELLAEAIGDVGAGQVERKSGEMAIPSPPNSRPTEMDLCQWQVSPNGIFRPAAKTIPNLEPGAYFTGQDDFGPFLKQQELLSDDIVDLPDSANQRILSSIKRFWAAKDRYAHHGLLFKRGLLLWGPPGSGKTVSIHLLARDLIQRGGIVLFCGHPSLMLAVLGAVRRIEPLRPLIVVLEDVDEIIGNHGEHAILSMLDGESQTSNVVYLASTNYPDRLGARIINRPSRFDECIMVDMPGEPARRAYFQAAARKDGNITPEMIDRWTQDTEGFSIAHLREMVAAVMCLDHPYADVLVRLRAMTRRPREVDGFAKKTIGLVQQTQGNARLA